MENETKLKKDFLYRYRNRMSRIRVLEVKKHITNMKMENVTAINYGEERVTGSGNKNSMEFLLDRKMHYERQISEEIKRGIEERREIIRAIDNVDDPLLNRILEAFFVDLMDVKDICKEIDRTERHYYRLYRKAICSIPVDAILINKGKMSVGCQ